MIVVGSFTHTDDPDGVYTIDLDGPGDYFVGYRNIYDGDTLRVSSDRRTAGCEVGDVASMVRELAAADPSTFEVL